MGNPLSFSASLIAVLGAANTVRKGINKILDLKDAPTVVLQISNEVVSLQADLQQIQSTYEAERHDSSSAADPINALKAAVDSAREPLMKLEQLINDRVLKVDGTVDKIAWLLEETNASKLQKQLRAIRQSISQSVIVSTSLHARQQETRLESIELVTSDGFNLMKQRLDQQELSQKQIENNLCLMMAQMSHMQQTFAALATAQSQQRIHQQAVCTDDDITETEDASDLFSRRPTGTLKHEAVSDSLQSMSHGVNAIRLNYRRRPKCPRSCKCRCHSKTTISSSPMLDSIFGKLIFGYTGSSLWSTSCSEESCSNLSRGAWHFKYQFPSWILGKAFRASMAADVPGLREFQFRTYNLLPLERTYI